MELGNCGPVSAIFFALGKIEDRKAILALVEFFKDPVVFSSNEFYIGEAALYAANAFLASGDPDLVVEALIHCYGYLKGDQKRDILPRVTDLCKKCPQKILSLLEAKS